MPTPDDVLRGAAATVGEVESPPNSNRTRFCDWYGLTGPWCAMWVSWVFAHQGLPLPASTAKGFAYTPSGAAWFQKLGRWTHTPKRGHVVFFDFPGDGVNRISHVGIVESVRADGSVATIEANTSPGNGGSQRDGGGVYRRVRSSGIVGYGIPAYTSAPTQEEDMTPEQNVMLVETHARARNLESVADQYKEPLARIEAELESLKVGGGQVDLDALAEKVADLLAERLKT